MCFVVSGVRPHSHGVSPLKYFHLFRCSFLHKKTVPNLLRHLHAVYGLVYPFAKLLSRLTTQLCGWYQDLPVLLFTAVDDFCREVSRSYGAKEAFSLQASLCWNLAVLRLGCVCFLFLLFHSSTYISSDLCGAIPASGYSSSTLVSLRHPVIDLHASFSSGSTLESCGDLNWACVFSRRVGQRQCFCSNGDCVTTLFGV